MWNVVERWREKHFSSGLPFYTEFVFFYRCLPRESKLKLHWGTFCIMTIGGKLHLALLGGGRGRAFVWLQLWHTTARQFGPWKWVGYSLRNVPSFCHPASIYSWFCFPQLKTLRVLKKYCHRTEFHCVKHKQKQHEERERVNWSQVVGLEVPRSRLQIMFEISQKFIRGWGRQFLGLLEVCS